MKTLFILLAFTLCQCTVHKHYYTIVSGNPAVPEVPKFPNQGRHAITELPIDLRAEPYGQWSYLSAFPATGRLTKYDPCLEGVHYEVRVLCSLPAKYDTLWKDASCKLKR